eukprot:CAMPEP_0115014560 /NCGR_PEP_ID=MMETSP0216-20121206/26165_1 /TAXON_ID=223996 /ORGANISM="Protocruzia adherens, Strain Boccale" /LENGTH=471 /DNA_ID=CAMNT_0002384351 /DNA_START=129 /DNA_END=1544 /DNA_ORIENTATION=+
MAKEKHEKLMEEYEQQKRSKGVVVPTEIPQVKARLRELGEPITLFGESHVDRRQRLKQVIAGLSLKGITLPEMREGADEEDEYMGEEENNELYYTPGSADLKNARINIVKHSLMRSQKRLMNSAKLRENLTVNDYEEAIRTDLAQYKTFEVGSSQFGDDRCVFSVKISPTRSHLATAGWSSVAKVWKVEDSKEVTTLQGHSDRINDICFHPLCGKSLPVTSANIATGSADGTVRLWSFKPDAERQGSSILPGHKDRVNKVEFHPMGRYLASSSYDRTWRLWDVETRQELLCQDGHGLGVYGMGFHPDGSLLVSGDQSGIAFIWDLRSGKSLMTMQAHASNILATKFSPNGYQCATASDDNTVKIWDLRKKRCLYTILAHNKLVSDIEFDPLHGNYLMTASYDQEIKLWSGIDWSHLATFKAHENKVTTVAIANNGQFFVSGSFDKTFKVWDIGQVAKPEVVNSDTTMNTTN